MYTRYIILFVLAVPVFLTGCAEHIIKNDDIEVAGGAPVGMKKTKDNLPAVANKRRITELNSNNNSSSKSNNVSSSETLIPKDPLSVKTILFDFDSSIIRADMEPILLAHSRHLTANAQIRVTLEGHADERGTREYNLALGEQRALTVKQFLMDNGVADGQLSTLSYGEERPIDEKDNEIAWAKNRRVDLAY